MLLFCESVVAEKAGSESQKSESEGKGLIKKIFGEKSEKPDDTADGGTSTQAASADTKSGSDTEDKDEENDEDKEVVATIFGKAYTRGEIQQRFPAAYHEMESQAYERLGSIVHQLYLEEFYKKWAKKSKVDETNARKSYMSEKVKVDESEVTKTIEKHKDNPQLKDMTPEKRKEVVRMGLTQRSERDAELSLLQDGMMKKEVDYLVKRPEKPRLDITIFKDDYVRYGPNSEDTKAIECQGDGCLITVVEYSEFECPYCARVPPVAKQVIEEYKGKIRWIVRDFPLDFHPRAVPTAIAAGCAYEQGKYWEMYNLLFSNQSDLSDQSIVKHAKASGIYNSKFKNCIAKPDKVKARVDRNYQSGVDLGVAGTPGFFINGRSVSVNLSFENFKALIDEELKNIALNQSH